MTVDRTPDSVKRLHPLRRETFYGFASSYKRMKRTAFQNLLNSQKDRVFGHAVYFLRNREDAEDVTQEVFVKLWNHWDSIDAGKAEAWLMRVTHRQCIDAHRRRVRARRRGEADACAEWDPDARGDTAPVSPSDPQHDFELNETQRTLIEAMGGLPAATRSMMLMHYFEDMTLECIGEVLGMTPNAVKVAIHRGRKNLGEILRTKYPEWSEEIRR
jgi:RNA polymerase sigma-70 factor (ECF subfamily)